MKKNITPNQLKSLVWFATHFRDLATIMHERAGVLNLNLAVEVGSV
jgi:DNA mismatch repair protein MSH4